MSGDMEERVERVTGGVGSGLIDLRAEVSGTGGIIDGDGEDSVVALGLPFS